MQKACRPHAPRVHRWAAAVSSAFSAWPSASFLDEQAPRPSLAASVVMQPVNARVRGIAGFVTRIFALLPTVAGGER